jgi:hypothetical protein
MATEWSGHRKKISMNGSMILGQNNCGENFNKNQSVVDIFPD